MTTVMSIYLLKLALRHYSLKAVLSALILPLIMIALLISLWL